MRNGCKKSFKDLIFELGYSEKAAEEFWKWYDPSDKKEMPVFDWFCLPASKIAVQVLLLDLAPSAQLIYTVKAPN